MTQEELAKATILKKSVVHQMETEKVEINAWSIPCLAVPLKKPLNYFYPKSDLSYDIKEGELSDLEKELIIYFRELESDLLRETLFKFAKIMRNYGTSQEIAYIFIKIPKIINLQQRNFQIDITKA